MDLNQRHLIDEFVDEYRACRFERRELLRRVLVITGSVPLTAWVLFTLGCGSSRGSVGSTATPQQLPATITPPGPTRSRTRRKRRAFWDGRTPTTSRPTSKQQ